MIVSIVPPLHLKELISEFSEHEFIIKEVTTKTGKNSGTKNLRLYYEETHFASPHYQSI